MDAYTKVATVADLQPGQLRRVTINDRDILLANVGGTILAVDAVCTHDDGPLDEGELEDDCIRCPWHFSLFSLRTGEVVESPAADPIASYDVRLEGEDILLVLGRASETS